MSQSIEDVVRVIEKAKELGVQEFEALGIRIKFQSGTLESPVKRTPVPDSKVEELVKPLSVLDEMTPEEILMYATPRYDEIQAEKEAQKEKLNSRSE